MRTTISVSGLTAAEVTASLSDLSSEFAERPWLLRAEATWDEDRARLVVVSEREGHSIALDGPDVAASLDEVWDCVIACVFTGSAKVAFHLDSVEFA